MSGILRAAGAAVLSLALLAPAGAHAERWTSTDEVGDVKGWSYDPEPKPCGTDTIVDGSMETNSDITRLRVRHTRRAVVVTTRFRDLDPELEQMVSLYLRSERRTWWLDLDRYQTRSGAWKVDTFLSVEPDYPDPDQLDECGGFSFISTDVNCRIGRDVDVAQDLARVAIPRTCLRNPRWVRVGADAYRFVDAEEPEDWSFTVFSDEWDGGTVLSEWTVSYGPRVRATPGATTGATTGRSASKPATTGARRELVVRDGHIFARR